MLVNLGMAFKALERNRLQASLTLSGMAIGVAMVVLVAGLGRGAQQRIEASIERAGPTRITVRSGNFQPASIAIAAFEEGSGGGFSQGGLGGGDGAGEPGLGDPDAMAATLKLREEAEAAARAAANKKVRSPAAPLTLEELEALAVRVPDVRAVAGSVGCQHASRRGRERAYPGRAPPRVSECLARHGRLAPSRRPHDQRI